jgi:hypothetical protein
MLTIRKERGGKKLGMKHTSHSTCTSHGSSSASTSSQRTTASSTSNNNNNNNGNMAFLSRWTTLSSFAPLNGALTVGFLL